MRESEKRLENELRRAVKNTGGLCLKMGTSFLSGIPDRLCLFAGGRVCFVEVKTTGEKPKKIQLFFMRKLEKLGFDVRIIDNTKALEELINYYG